MRLLAYERATSGADDSAAAVTSRVYDRLHGHLAPLLGGTGVQLLLARSAKVTSGERAGPGAVGDAESAAALLGTFLALLTTFIGERLVTQVLRSAWPTIEEATSGEDHLSDGVGIHEFPSGLQCPDEAEQKQGR